MAASKLPSRTSALCLLGSLIVFALRWSSVSGHYCQSCPPAKPGVLNVHIVSHTHLDTGWTSTYDQYYNRYVPVIYNSVVESLSQNSRRKFIAVETSYFSRWYNSQSKVMQQLVQQLVQTGQLEFIGGGWSMNDEGASFYSSIIDNLSLGHKWLNQTFGRCGITKTGWQIDPFGHSREQASLFAQMGFDALFLGRIDYQDKNLRERMKTLEYIWKASPSIGDRCDLFTGVLPNVYWPPTGFCFDINCFDETLNDKNVLRRARDFVQLVRQQSYHYATNHTIITMGMDFYFQSAEKWFSNLDLLIGAVNSMTATEKVHVFYSTPSCYAKALNEQRHAWPIKLDDNFPYADAQDAYWTGYFTSRPSLKYAVKKGANLLQASNQLNVLALKGMGHSRAFQEMKETMAVLQHHDAITGTCKQFVNDDYQRMLSLASDSTEAAVVSAYLTLTQAKIVPGQSSIGFCRQLNTSQCIYTELIDDQMDSVVSIYNPIAHPLRHFVRLPVKNMQFTVLDHYGAQVPSQLVPIHPKIGSLKERMSMATYELVFMSTLDPLGISSYLITKANADYEASALSEKLLMNNEDVLLHNGKIGILIDGITGFMKEIQLPSGDHIPMVQSFWYYQANGRYSGSKPSGAYAFSPSHKNPYIVNTKASYKIYRGPLVDEVHQVFSDWCTQVIRLYRNYNYVEFDWVIGPLPTGKFPNEHGIEVITRYETTLQNKNMFYTDANGRETIRRTRDFRPTWELQTGQPVASNYYPVTSWLFLRDLAKDLQMTILTDRSQGGSSMMDGTLELMLHRRLLFDDAYGMEEALNEPGFNFEGLVVRGRHRLIVDGVQESVRFLRKLSKTTSWTPLYLFRNTPKVHSRNLVTNLNFVGTMEQLPVNIHLLSLEQWDESRILIRLEHFYEINEDFKYSRETEVKLHDLFSTFIIVDVREMSLSGTEYLEESDASRMRWIAESNPYENYTSVFSSIFTKAESNSIIRDSNSFTILMKPMQIRTFLVYIRPRN